MHFTESTCSFDCSRSSSFIIMCYDFSVKLHKLHNFIAESFSDVKQHAGHTVGFTLQYSFMQENVLADCACLPAAHAVLCNYGDFAF